MRYDLAFFLCCCKSFFGDDKGGKEDFYSILDIERDASSEDIKKAYKKKSLQMHPDKLAQKGRVPTEEDQEQFTRMKEAYEILSDPHKRETYDAIGERGMKWMEEPFSLDPQELAHNFATSSVLDRSKVFAIFVGIAVAVFLLPLIICLQVDGVFGPQSKWMAILTPLWIWNSVILFYHARVIMMGPIAKPDHISPEEWVDPLPMKKRIFSMVRFLLICVLEFLITLKLDDVLKCSWILVFMPYFIWEATTLYKKVPLARMRIVTVQDLEAALGKPFFEFSAAEKEVIGKRYSVVPSTTCPEFEAAQKLKVRAKHDLVKATFRIVFCLLLLLQLEQVVYWNWWVVFLPFWFMTALFCYANYTAFQEVKQMAAEKDPTLFGGKTSSDYGAMGKDGTPTPAPPSLTEEERDELRAQVMASSSRLTGKCCSQGFLLIIVMLFVAKIQGAGFSAIWIISPVLFVALIILCCIGCAIFGIQEVNTDGVDFDAATVDIEAQAASYAPPPPTRTIPIPVVVPAPAPTPVVAPASAPAAAPVSVQPIVDLLDDNDSSPPPTPQNQQGVQPTSTASYDLD